MMSCAVPTGLRKLLLRFPSTDVLGYVCVALRASSSTGMQPEGRHNPSPARKRWVPAPILCESRSDGTTPTPRAGRAKFLRVLLLICTALITVSARAIDRDAFTTTSYHLTAQIDRASHVMAVTGTLTLRNDAKDPQKVVALQVTSSFAWNSITLDDKPVQWLSDNYTSDIDHTGSLTEAIVNLPKAVAPAGTITLAVQYGGSITPDATRLTRVGTPADVAARSDWDEISDAFTAVRGLGYVTWYPVAIEAVSISDGNAVFDALAAWKRRHAYSEFNARLVVAGAENEPLCIAVNSGVGCGEAKLVTEATAGGRSKEFSNTLALSGLGKAVPAFTLGNYVELSRPTITLLHTGEHTSLARDYAVAAEANDPLLRDWLWDPRQPARVIELTEPKALPYESGDVLFTPLRPWPADTLQLLLLSTQVAARFQSAHPWIEEGLQRFLQCIVIDSRSGRKAALDYLDDFREPLVKAEEATHPKSGDAAKVPDNSADNTLLNTNDELYLRGKGSFVFWMLRDMLGDTALRAALANYRYGADKDPAYWQRLLQASSKRDLEWFFDDWVYRDRGLPDFHVESSYARPLLGDANQSFLETVTIMNTGRAGAEVPVIVQTASGEKTVRVLAKAGEKGVGRIEIPVAPDKIIVNDGSVPEANTGNKVYNVPAPQ